MSWVDPAERKPEENQRVSVTTADGLVHPCLYWEAVNGCALFWEVEDGPCKGWLLMDDEIVRWAPMEREDALS